MRVTPPDDHADSAERNAASHRASATRAHQRGLAALTIGAMGIVYGDIGTSPLYALNQIFLRGADLPLTPETVLGGISLVVWTITVIVAIKYAIFVLRAQNDGEGGVFALYGLLHHYRAAAPRS